MKCPVCNRDVIGKSCSYCGTVIDLENENQEIKEEKQQLNSKLKLFSLLIFLSIVSVIIPIFYHWLTLLSLGVMAFNLFYLFKKLKPSKYLPKNKVYVYFSVIVLCGLLSLIPFGEFIGNEYKAHNAYKEYSKIVDVYLPRKESQYEYISNLDKGYKIERFIFKLSEDEKNTLIESNEHFEVISDKNKNIFNIWYSDIKDGYYIVYNILDNNYLDVKDMKLYHYVIIVVKSDNTVIVDEVTKTPTEVE